MLAEGKPLQLIDTRPKHFVSRQQDIADGVTWRDPERVTEWIGELSKEKPVVVYCESGMASGTAARALRAGGFNKVVTLRGGLQSWRQENLPLVKGAARKDGKHA